MEKYLRSTSITPPFVSVYSVLDLIFSRSKSPYTVSENKYTLGISGTTNTLSPILEDKSPSSHDIRPLDLTAINLHQNHPPLAASTTTTARGILNKRDSFQATARSFNQSGRRSSIERTESTSSIGSWKSISRCNSGMISRCDSTNSINNDPQLLQQLPLRERKFRKQQKILLNKARAENQQWYSGFNTNLGESIQAGPDKMNIKEFFLEFDAKKDK